MTEYYTSDGTLLLIKETIDLDAPCAECGNHSDYEIYCDDDCASDFACAPHKDGVVDEYKLVACTGACEYD